MRRSEERILTTHVGSLPREPVLTDLLIREEAGEAVDRAELARRSESAVRHVVERQTASGVDVVNDGEQPRVGFQTYVAQRMKGFGGESKRPRPRDYTRLPGLLPRSCASACPGAARCRMRRRRSPRWSTTISAPAEDECRMFRSALDGLAVAAGRDLHDGGVARHHRHDDAERPLRQPRGLCLRAGAPDAQGIRADRARLHPADRCARPRAWSARCCSRTRPSPSSSRSPRCMSRR